MEDRHLWFFSIDSFYLFITSLSLSHSKKHHHFNRIVVKTWEKQIKQKRNSSNTRKWVTLIRFYPDCFRKCFTFLFGKLFFYYSSHSPRSPSPSPALCVLSCLRFCFIVVVIVIHQSSELFFCFWLTLLLVHVSLDVWAISLV